VNPDRCDLSFGDAIEIIEKSWIGDGGALGVADHGRAGRSQSRYGEGHGDTVVAVRLDFRAAQFSCGSAFDAQAVRAFFYRGAHAAKVFGEGCDAIAFFDAQFRGVANLNSLLGVGT